LWPPPSLDFPTAGACVVFFFLLAPRLRPFPGLHSRRIMRIVNRAPKFYPTIKLPMSFFFPFPALFVECEPSDTLDSISFSGTIFLLRRPS